jgi:hypothetical protein
MMEDHRHIPVTLDQPTQAAPKLVLCLLCLQVLEHNFELSDAQAEPGRDSVRELCGVL